MHRFDTENNVATPPAIKPAVNAPGYASDGPPGTVWSADLANDVVETLNLAIEGSGQTLTKGDWTQLLQAIQGAFAAKADSLDTGVVSSFMSRVVMASDNSQASSSRSGVLCSGASLALGSSCVVAGSFDSQAGQLGANQAVLACNDARSGDLAAADFSIIAGSRSVQTDEGFSAILACEGDDRINFINNGEHVAILATEGDGTDNVSVALAASRLLIAASKGVVVDAGAADAVVLGSQHARVGAPKSVVLGSGDASGDTVRVSGTHSSVIGCVGAIDMQGAHTMLLASDVGSGGFVNTDNFKVLLANTSGVTIDLDSVTGRVTCQSLDVNSGDATNGGVTPAMMTDLPNGATGGAFTWVGVRVAGTLHYMPAWTAV